MVAVPTVSSALLQGVADPNVKRALQALVDANNVRSGDVGDGKNAFLTRSDLTGGGDLARTIALALARPIADAVSPATGDSTPLAGAVEQRILASAAWQRMFDRVELLNAPDSLPGSVSNQLLTEAKARGAAVTNLTTTIKDTNESLAATKTTLTAGLKDNAAAIEREEKARTTATDALAQSQATYVAATDKALAAVQSDLTVRTNSDNALASALNTLWTRIGANTALVQSGNEIVANNVGSVVTKFEQLQAVTTDPNTGLVAKYAALRTEYNITNDKVNGMSGKWSVKLDLNGYISGLSLNAGVDASGRSESAFIIAADVFAIGQPGKSNIVPFYYDTRTGLLAIKGSMIATGTVEASALRAKSLTAESGVIGDLAVTNANIANAAITTAKIGDASVNTLKIAGNSVTAMASGRGSTEVNISISALGVPIFLAATCYNEWSDAREGGNYLMYVVMLRDGIEISRVVTSAFCMAHTGGQVAATGIFVDYPSAGVHRYTFRSYPTSGAHANGIEDYCYGAAVSAALLETRR